MNASHRNTFDSIPWLVNGRINDDERRSLDAHLRECEECRSELAAQRRLHAVVSSDDSRIDYAPGASLQKLWARIGDTTQNEARPDSAGKIIAANFRRGAGRPRLMQWLVAAMVVEAVAIAVLAAASVRKPEITNAASAAPPVYKVVTSSDAVRTNPALRVVFAPNLPVSEINALLRQERLAIVNGPSAADVYTLAIPATATDLPELVPGILANLRKHPGVRFAEPIAHATESKP